MARPEGVVAEGGVGAAVGGVDAGALLAAPGKADFQHGALAVAVARLRAAADVVVALQQVASAWQFVLHLFRPASQAVLDRVGQWRAGGRRGGERRPLGLEEVGLRGHLVLDVVQRLRARPHAFQQVAAEHGCLVALDRVGGVLMVLPCMAIMPSTPMLISSRATSTSIMLKPDWCSDLCRDFNSMTGAPWRKVRVGSGRPG